MAREINVDASGIGFTNATTPAVIPGSAFTIPAQNVGILRSVVLNLNNMVTTSIVSWRFRVDSTPLEGWSNLTIFPRNAGFAASGYGPDETYIFLPEGVTVDVQIIVAAGDPNAYQAGVTYHGWSYPKRLDEEFSTLYVF